MTKVSYGFGEDQLQKDSIPFPVSPGVDNVELEKCSYVAGEKDGDPWECIKFEYKRVADGETMRLSDSRWAVNIDNVKATEKKSAEENATDQSKQLNTQLKHIATKFGITTDQLKNLSTDGTFKSTATAYCALVNAKCKGVKLYCKTIRNGRYVNMAKYPAFLQIMDGPCTLSYTDNELKAMKATAPQGVVSDESVNAIV